MFIPTQTLILKNLEPKAPRTHWLKQLMAVSLMVMTLSAPLTALSAPGPSSQGISLKGGISIGAHGNETVSALSLRDAEIKDVLYGLADQAQFNLIVDKSVTGTISLDLKNISVNKVLEYIMTLANLTYYKDGNTVIITTAAEANTQSLNRLVLKSVPVKYNDAATIAQFLNSTVFGISRPGGNAQSLAAADQRTNSILIMGNEQDIELANRALAELDFPLQRKTFFLKYAAAQEVANAISQTLYSTNLILLSAPPAQAGAQAGGVGGAQAGGVGGAQAGGGAGGGAVILPTGAPLNVTMFRGGPLTFVINQANNTMTLVGTNEQIDQAASMLYDLDIRPAQVAMEVSILSISDTKSKGFNTGLNQNTFATGDNATTTRTTGETVRSRVPTANGGVFQVPNGGLSFGGGTTLLTFDKTLGTRSGKLFDNMTLSAQLRLSRSKTLANPTLLTLSGQAATISSTRTIVSGVSTITNATGVSQTNITTSPVGINLALTPTVFNDGTIGMQITPTISNTAGQVDVSTGGDTNSITLQSSINLNIAQARVKDGETIILAGFLQESEQSSTNPVPFLGNLPLVGGFFRNGSSNNKSRDEIVILVTPHIIKEEGVPYFRKDWQEQISYKPQPGMSVHAPQAPVTIPESGKSYTETLPAASVNTPIRKTPDSLPAFSEVLK